MRHSETQDYIKEEMNNNTNITPPLSLDNGLGTSPALKQRNMTPSSRASCVSISTADEEGGAPDHEDRDGFQSQEEGDEETSIPGSPASQAVSDCNVSQCSTAKSSSAVPPHSNINVNRAVGNVQSPKKSLPYKDHSAFTVNALTDNDKKTLRLYEENAVIGGPFPVKLQIILKVTELLGQQHIISWLPHGRSFMIHRPLEFEEKVMGEFFKQTKLSSFKRQLNLYDFKRVTRGTDCGSYYHEMFLKGKPLLAKRMVRRKIKGTCRTPSNKKNQPSSLGNNNEDDDQQVPDFYTMPMVDPSKIRFHELQQLNRVALMQRSSFGSSLGSMGLQDQLFAGGITDKSMSSPLAGIHGPAGAGAGGPLGSIHLGGEFQSSSYPQSLSHQSLAASQLSSQYPLPNDLSLASLQQLRGQQQQLLSNHHSLPMQDLLPPPQRQIDNSYLAAMENLNSSYALAADSIQRNFTNPSAATPSVPISSILSQQNDLLKAKQQLNNAAYLNNYEYSTFY